MSVLDRSKIGIVANVLLSRHARAMRNISPTLFKIYDSGQ